ncbi:hypothetical protein EOA13_11085 [Mesorhizobium sp. M7A.F.Ca.US.011.01.1.1]|uniref:EH signature domain-containing protein n=1 Tax=Mesorhizobium sp. M7A.F.Ca.US.011.01.1.1 TaxID=2496741 RepID=UPI000FCC4FE7|nr:EH signature domain-containing protein [Mesorhizobium sp. M7A.F.Ca.US.011.01.1.1]RUX29924.1 hypothetical protein EOA13_11085 [Mesorhizobium sp. M7A.F.Ca.US.011.01.1.1]
MSLLKEAIRQIASRPLMPPKLRDEPAVVRAAQGIIGGDGMDLQRNGKDYDKIAGELLLRLIEGDSLTSRELQDTAWCLWQTRTPLADVPVALRSALGGIESCGRKPPGRALASSFLYSFAPERPGMPEASATLCRIAERLGKPWAELQTEFALLDWKKGPPSVAGRALDLRKSPTEILAKAGLRAQDSLSGYVQACGGELLLRLANTKAISTVERLSLVEAIALNGKRKLIFEPHGPLVANALLLAFGDREPDDDLKQQYLDLLLALFDDPRLRPGNWTRMEEAAGIAKRWLTKQTLRQFLDIVDQVALERMFLYRRKFWEAVYQLGLIHAAWVVFDTAASRLAFHTFGKELRYGRFDGSVQSGQCVLILRVGRGVVAEWSHMGKCIIWNDAEAADAPQLYEGLYRPHRLRSNASDSIHHSVFAVTHWPLDGPSSWQTKVANKLHQMNGIRIPSSSYKVSG